MSIKENYAVNHRLVTDLPLVISGWLKVDRRSGTRINELAHYLLRDFFPISKLPGAKQQPTCRPLHMLFKIVKCNMSVQADDILLPADPRTRHHHSFKFKHIQSHTTQYKHCFLSGQYLSGTLFLKPVSTRIPSPHSRRSTITRHERCAHPPSS